MKYALKFETPTEGFRLYALAIEDLLSVKEHLPTCEFEGAYDYLYTVLNVIYRYGVPCAGVTSDDPRIPAMLGTDTNNMPFCPKWNDADPDTKNSIVLQLATRYLGKMEELAYKVEGNKSTVSDFVVFGQLCSMASEAINGMMFRNSL